MYTRLIRNIIILLSIITNLTYSWVYPEHRDITLLAIQQLHTDKRLMLDKLWEKAIKNYENRLSVNIIEPYQFRNPKFLDYASWPAISGDHSCSPQDLLEVVLNSDWILNVADISAKLKIDLNKYGSKDSRLTENALRDADILLQRADPNYATRAGSNNVHFLLALSNENIGLQEFLLNCLEEGTEINAISAYAWFHYSALLKISNVTNDNHSEIERSTIIRSALADEAYAIHFLQDVFAAGHVAGTWGTASQRKGTHDYYNKRGLKTSTWDGENIVLTGDAYLRKQDAERCAEAVRLSLEQFLNASVNPLKIDHSENMIFTTPDSMNVCKTNNVLSREYNNHFMSLLENVIKKTPIPGLKSGIGELPRFRAELGLFAGIAPSIHGSIISGGFGKTQETIGVTGGIEASIRIGFGLDGVLNEAGDGLIYLGFGWREDGASSIGVFDISGTEKYGSLLSAIPGRSALYSRLRLPFYLFPGDLLWLGPIIYFFSPKTVANMAVIAGNGGLIPWHTGIASPIGRFQVILGREFGLYLYGRLKSRDALFLLTPNDIGFIEPAVVSYRSTQIEFPFLEYRPTRSFSTNQSSTLLIQFYTGIDIPHNIEVLDSEYPISKPRMKNVWFWGMRMVFDWRHYL